MFEFVQDDEKRMPKVRKAPQTFTEALYNLGEILYGKTPEREVRGGWDERPERREQERENYGFEIPPYVPERIPAIKNDDLWYHVAQKGDPQTVRKVEEKPIHERVYPSQAQNSDLYDQPRISKGQNINPEQPSSTPRYIDNRIDKDWAQEITSSEPMAFLEEVPNKASQPEQSKSQQTHISRQKGKEMRLLLKAVLDIISMMFLILMQNPLMKK